jgi:hypothetical protein
MSEMTNSSSPVRMTSGLTSGLINWLEQVDGDAR